MGRRRTREGEKKKEKKNSEGMKVCIYRYSYSLHYIQSISV
jgi:hypothetical protein